MDRRQRPNIEEDEIIFSEPTGDLVGFETKVIEIEKPSDTKKKEVRVRGQITKRLNSDSLNQMVLKKAEEIIKNLDNNQMLKSNSKNTMPLTEDAYNEKGNKKYSLIHKDTREEINISNNFVIGAGNGANYIVNNNYITKKHAVFYIEKYALLVKDLNSLNGTLVNEKNIEKLTVRVKPGDIVTFANEEFIVK